MSKTIPSIVNKKEFLRYSRQIILPEIGESGQKKLKQTSVLIIGLGGLGSPLAIYLAAAGIGKIGIVEFDSVDESNLHRQIIYSTASIGKNKLLEGTRRLKELNPEIEIIEYSEKIQSDNARNIIRNFDIVADGADNFTTRYVVNDACVFEKKPLVPASILGFEGQLTVLNYQDGPCYRCLYESPPEAGIVPSCAEGGVLGVLPGVLGTLQATEVLKIALCLGSPLTGRLLHYDALQLQFNEFKFYRDQKCAACGDNPTIRQPGDGIGDTCIASEDKSVSTIEAKELKKILQTNRDDIILIDIRNEHEIDICKIDGSMAIPLEKILANQHNIVYDKTIFLYCQKGVRSAAAASHLSKHGYTKVFSLAGGILAWFDDTQT